jgi:hypothetical protein
MRLKRSPQRDPSRLELLGATRDSYVSWRHESRAVAEAYRAWSLAVGTRRRAAFDRYVAALDREEQAARGYGRLVDRAHTVCDPRVGAC